MIIANSPLRYPGGKAKLFPFFADLIVRNGLLGCDYKEVYAGGGGLALNLLAGGFVRSIQLNDLDVGIFSFWRAALDENDRFCQQILDTEISIDEWHKQQGIYRTKSSSPSFELGFATYFLNRTNRSGIISGAGPIGGYAQANSLKLDARFDKTTALKRIRLVGQFSQRITATNCDAREYLDNEVSSTDLVYLDPPYYIKGQRLYKNAYAAEDHKVIADRMRSCNAHWVVSYDDVPEIRLLYKGFHTLDLSLRYSAYRSAPGQEVVFVGSTLSVAETQLKVA